MFKQHTFIYSPCAIWLSVTWPSNKGETLPYQESLAFLLFLSVKYWDMMVVASDTSSSSKATCSCMIIGSVFFDKVHYVRYSKTLQTSLKLLGDIIPTLQHTLKKDVSINRVVKSSITSDASGWIITDNGQLVKEVMVVHRFTLATWPSGWHQHANKWLGAFVSSTRGNEKLERVIFFIHCSYPSTGIWLYIDIGWHRLV